MLPPVNINTPEDNENTVDVLIRRFKSGDEEVLYEKIQSAADLQKDSMDGDTRISKFSVSGLPVPSCTVEERLKPLNPFYVDKSKMKKKFIPDISNSSVTSQKSITSSDKAALEIRKFREGKTAAKAAMNHVITAIVKNPSEKAIKKHTSKMPVSYNSFIAQSVIAQTI